MDVINILGLITCVALALSGWVYGWKFLRLNNYLLGLEWWVIAFSASNFVAAMVTESDVCFAITMFLDAFSRGLGVPIIATLGFMAVTHSFKPKVATEVALFAAAFAGTAVLYLGEFFDQARPYFYLIMYAGYAVYIAYFISRLVKVGEMLQALGATFGLLAGGAVAIVYDFFPIPGDDTHMIFMTWAFVTWTYSTVQMYYAYVALLRAKDTAAGALAAAR